MKHNLLISLISATVLACSISFDAQALPSNFYVKKSVLSEGNWVKIGVEETGLYEISYNQLRKMGFTNPEKVGVFGRGAKMMSINFVDEAGNPLIDNDLSQIPILHQNDKIIFFGCGPENIQLTPATNQVLPYFYQNMGRNIYSNRGFYFLSETDKPLLMQNATEVDDAPILNKGISFISHELDLEQNNTSTGNLFWGERFNAGNPATQSWKVALNNAVNNSKAIMSCEFYVANETTGTLEWGIENASDNLKTPINFSTSYIYQPITPTVASITVPNASSNVYIKYDADNINDYANLDFWTLTYQRSIPTLTAPDKSLISQDRIAFTDIKDSKVSFLIPNGLSFSAIDISDPLNPMNIAVKPHDSDGKVTYVSSSTNPEVIIFDSRRTLLQISGFEKDFYQITNQDLHQKAQEGAELIIITTPELKEKAENLADIHRRYDKIEVIVATTEEIYNEFSAGVPDPMAYRSFVRMVYDHGSHNLKNLLLFGPMNNDSRGLIAERNPYSTIIAYQSPIMDIDNGAHNVNDIYGMMSDRLSKDLEVENLEIGIGVIPVQFLSDADRIINKIEDYITNPDHAYTLNQYLSIGGLGDNHTHDDQAIALSNFINTSTSNHMVISNLIVDAYGATQARNKLFEYFNTGKGIVTYFGHGSTVMLGQDKRFFSGDNVREFRNTRLPFMMFAGCILTNFDRGQRGIAESMVLSTRHGLIGSLAATRSTWSGQNMDFFKIYLNHFFRENASITGPRLTYPLTLGEIYSRSKTMSIQTNELAFHLIADPALIIPVAHRRISLIDTKMKAAPGSEIRISGSVVLPFDNSTVDANFNGTVVIKLLQPEMKLVSQDLETGSNTTKLTVPYCDYVITEVVGEVERGKFSLFLPIPASATEFIGKECNVVLSAYNPDTRSGAGSRAKLTLTSDLSGNVIHDDIAPVIDIFEYLPASKELSVKVSDNYALDMSQSPFSNGFYMTIDGRSYSAGIHAPKTIDLENPSYSKTISVSHLGYGSHSARLTVRDVMGNSTTKEIVFIIDKNTGSFELNVEESIVDDSCRFSYSGSPSDPRLVIIDINGNHVFEHDMSMPEFIWDRTDNNGDPLKPGLYKAFILETGNHGYNGHSNTIDLPLI